jgi:hypothetical protein
MAQQFITDAGVLIIPGAYPQIKVQSSTSGLSTTGVIALVGEADAGPDFTLESDLTANAFGPDALADVLAKYKSGPLVDAFRGASVPANDPDIVGSPSSFILVKTNPSAKASGILPKIGGGTYGLLEDKSYGKLGNLIYFSVAASTAESKPTTGSFTFIPPVGTVNTTLRANGGAALAVGITAAEAPSAVQAAIDALSGIACSGGTNRVLVPASGTLAVGSISGNTATFTYSANWSVSPVVGDTLVVSATSVVAGAGNANVGAYVVTAVTATTVTATKLSDAAKPSAVPGTITAPVSVAAQAVVSTTADLTAYAPLTITLEAGNVIDGVGKTLEINELTSGTDLLSRCCYQLGTATPSTFVSKTSAPALVVSAAEYAVTVAVNRQVDNVQESFTAGGQIAFQLGYVGTTCSVTVTPTMLSTTVTGGSGANLSVSLKDFATLNDLAAYISTQPGYVAKVGSAAVGQLLSTALDEGTFNAGTTFGAYTLRLKVDAVRFFQAISSSAVVQLNNPAAQALAGLPDVTSTSVFLANGAKGGTTNALVQSALAALEGPKLNFVVPCFSRDASLDIADGLTDSTSTYDIASIHAAVRTHVNAVSTLKRRRNRQGFLSIRDTFVNAKNAAAGLASSRLSLTFQDVKDLGANGVQQFQPWMGAAKAAGMQAAGFYRAIFNKGINISGALQAAADFKDSLDSNVEDALLSGLMPIRKSDDGGFKFASDQTTYLKDDNFFFNSIQAQYVGDIIALTTAQLMEKAFVGQSVADVSAAVAMSALEGIMANFLRLKLIAVSDDAPKGFKNAKIQISGTTMKVQVEIKLAGAIYFIPINFLVTQVTQSASS